MEENIISKISINRFWFPAVVEAQVAVNIGQLLKDRNTGEKLKSIREGNGIDLEFIRLRDFVILKDCSYQILVNGIVVCSKEQNVFSDELIEMFFSDLDGIIKQHRKLILELIDIYKQIDEVNSQSEKVCTDGPDS